MNVNTGETFRKSNDEPEQPGEIPITEREFKAVEKVPFEDRVAELGAIRYMEKANIRGINVLMVKLAFKAGYHFCKAMHQLAELTAKDMPATVPPKEALDKAQSEMKTNLGGQEG